MSCKTIVTCGVVLSLIMMCACFVEKTCPWENEYAYSKVSTDTGRPAAHFNDGINRSPERFMIYEALLPRCNRRCNEIFGANATDSFYLMCRDTCYAMWLGNELRLTLAK